MNLVAGNAGDFVFYVTTDDAVHVIGASGVTGKTGLISQRRGQFRRIPDVGCRRRASVGSPRPVT